MSFSAFWGAFGLLHANYGRVVDGGDKEYQIMFGTFGYEDDFSEAEEDEEYIDGYLFGIKGASGIKGSYRKYRNGFCKRTVLSGKFKAFKLFLGLQDGWPGLDRC